MTELKDQFIDVNGYKTRFWSQGSADSVIILLHGFALSVELWEQNINELAQDHRVIALDLLGFGLTDKPKGKHDINIFPDFVYAFMQKMNILKAHLVGHSMGGLIATRLAQIHPESILSLIILSGAGFKKNIPIHFRIFSLPFIGEILARPNKRGLESALRKNTYERIDATKKLAEKLYEFSLHPEMAALLLKVTRTAINFFGFKNSILRTIKKECNKLTMPVLIIWGQNDSIIYVSHAYTANKIIPNSKLVIFDNCGHLPQLEHPKKFNNLLREFYKNIAKNTFN
ncbi:alpha/beta fold hydrolase [Silvanigrella aquatica]|uniref:AB hydrolase-1 domain-containing protein n=1 Tax=Silvanigrella aquatica TaxID=1915309 RepID=A0A1L4D210_9BACT|nr:alpha/beta hydrolase [Silvanigrella aquatica]APJ04232.1 hypothetical protein AXG55_10065 [Silvanigrella aquatica]